MIEEVLSDDERLLLLALVTEAWVRIRDDPDMPHAISECQSIIEKLSGPDTRVVCRSDLPDTEEMVFAEP